MGQLWSHLKSLYDSLGRTEARILMLGLDAAGKTTILYKLKLNESITTLPTIGFNVEKVSPTSNITFTVWDVGGQESIRKLWHHYFYGSEGLIYVVDSADSMRFEEAKSELDWILNEDEMRGVPLVILANKQDLPNATKPSELAEKLGLHQLKNRQWYIQGSCAVNGDGIYEGLDKLTGLVKKFQKEKDNYT